ncbi:MAG: permease [Clostridiales bacterium GWF2_36_10]|nr:MAG: permease [Clostridiales bacterium GWF2_36_10]HAN20064.1 sulfite exporter TauE/SafE family protein [Clostridiales bacterium]
MDLLAIFAILVAYVVKGLCGFANTLIFSSIIGFSTNNIIITPVELIVGYPSNLLIAWKDRKSLSRKVYLTLSILVFLGSIPGAIFLKNSNPQILKILFTFAIIFIGIEMFFRERQKIKKTPNKIVLMIIGIFSGILSGLFGIGALLVAYVGRTTENQSQFRGNICLVFLMDSTFRIILYSFTGIFTVDIFKQAILLLPFMIIGLFIGILLSKKINESVIKKFVILLLILSGVSLLINNINII